nr:DUF6049 family protein [Kineosporia mesophila]
MANVRRGLTTGMLTMAITLGVLGPSTAPALAASSRQAQPSNTTPEQVTTTTGGPSASSKTLGTAAASRNLQLTLSRVSPTSVTAQDDLVVTGVARNFSARALKNVTVSLRFSYTALDGRDAVVDWVEKGDVATTGTLLKSQDLGSIRAKQSVPFTLTVPAGGLGLSSWSSSFGPRPFSLVASSAAGRQLDAIRSTLVWAPQGSDSKLGLTLLAPLTSVVPSTTAGLATEEAAAELLPDSRLSRILTATDDPAIGWAVDPALLAAAQSLKEGGISDAATKDDEEADGDEPTSSSSASPSQPPDNEAATELGISNETAKTAGTAWLSRITSGRKKRTVLGLPYADTDLNSLLKGGKSSGLLRQSDKLGESIEKEALGSSLYSRIAWPADGQISRQAIDGLVDTGHQSVILSEGQQPADPEISYTPNGKSTVRSKDNTLTGLLYDDELSGLFTDSGRDPGAETTQTMLAVLAAISTESAVTTSDSQSRQVLAVAPRNWDPRPGDVQRLTSALREASWVSLSSLKKLGQSSAVDRESHRYGRKALRSELPKGNLSNALAMDRELGNIAPALINNQDVVQRLEQRITSLLSYAWRSDLDGQAQARRAVMDDVGDLTGKVQLLIGTESKVFTARSALIPVTVDNKTDFDLRVSVSFSAGSGQLKIDRQPDPVTILAGHRQSFRVEATAIATGNVLVQTKLLTGEGTKQRVLGSPQTFEVKVRPKWESWGMIGMAVLLGLLLLVGLLRSFRRNKTRPKVPLSTIPDIDDEATRAARKATKEAAPRVATDEFPAANAPDTPSAPADVTDSAPIQRSAGATERSPQGSGTGEDKLRASGTGSASGTPGTPRGMHEQKSSSVPTMAATKGAERRSPTMPKENR